MPGWLAAHRFPLRTLVRFGLVGLVGAAVNQGVFAVLHLRLAVPLLLASAIATQVAIFTNYLGNELWTFPARRLAHARFRRFQLTALGGLLVTAGSLWLLTRAPGLPVLVANLGAIALGSAWNFIGNVRWTWKGTV